MGLVSMTACIWCLAFIVVNPKSSSVTSKRHQRVSDPQMYTYVGLETKHGRKLMQLVCKSQTAASSLAKSSEKTSKRWVFYSAKSCRIWLARFQTPKLQAGILLAKKKKDNKDKKGSLMVYSCGKIHCVLHILIMFSLNLLLQTLHH